MHESNIAADADRMVVLDYTNYRGERKTYTVIPHSWKFGVTEWHPKPQWCMICTDVDRNVVRTFAVKDIHTWQPKERT